MLATTSSSKTLLVGLVVLAAGLAGCADGGSGLPGSYQEAKQAPGTTWQANGTDTPIELRLLQPSDTTVNTGEQDIVFLLYDSEADEPIEDAQFDPQDRYDENCSPAHSYCAQMPAMGHGTGTETSPQHVEFGVYRASSDFIMSGPWVVNVNPMIDGEVIEYDIGLTAEGEGEGDMDMEG